jgi:putative peptidoglycan binding protein
MSEPTRETRAASRGERPPDDDWHLDDVEWFDESSRPARDADDARAGTAGPSRAGDRDTGGRPPTLTGQSAAIRRRRIAALAVLGALFIVALVIPLVVFSGGGENAAQPTPAPATTPLTAATAPRTTTQERSATTTTSQTTTQAAPLRVTLPAGAALSRGDRGSAVVQLQKGLAALGFAAGEPDGVFGATTEAAVVDFQQSNNLTPDGVVGTDTVRLLNAALTKKGATE